jgi:cytochrome c biogenesis protein CcmG/thiol:disulfide interchange protein DsbE
MTSVATAGGGGRRRIALWSALAVAAVVAVLIAVLATSKSAGQVQQQANSPLQGKLAPEISGPQIDGATTKLSSFRGKWVLVNFFASWCVPCQQEQGDLVRFQNRHQAAGDAVIFAVRFDDPDDGPIRQLMNKSGAHWPVVDAADAKIQWGVTGPPESFLVDPAGYVLAHIVGRVNADGLDSLLTQAKSSEVGTPP